MAFDIEMIKKVYERMPERVDSARSIVGRPLTLAEKSFMLTSGKRRQQKLLLVEKIMWILLPTASPVRTLPLKWRSYSSCTQESPR